MVCSSIRLCSSPWCEFYLLLVLNEKESLRIRSESDAMIPKGNDWNEQKWWKKLEWVFGLVKYTLEFISREYKYRI